MTPTLFVRTLTSRFESHKTYPDYKSAVKAGQEIAGCGNFYVETGTHVPTREEQLLLPVVPRPRRRSRKQELIDSI